MRRGGYARTRARASLPAVVAAAMQRAAERGASVAGDFVDGGGCAANLDAIVRSLPSASWELELIVALTPYLRGVTRHLAHADEYLLVNSEVYAWLRPSTTRSCGRSLICFCATDGRTRLLRRRAGSRKTRRGSAPSTECMPWVPISSCLAGARGPCAMLSSASWRASGTS